MDAETRCSTGGRRSKTRRAEEEEARRREVVREQLREKTELEKRALRLVEGLLEDSVDEQLLIHSAKFMTSAHYKDAIEERSIGKLCGYPTCSNKLGNVPNQKFKISTKTNKVYDLTERKSFCSNFCYKASKHFELQISSTPLWMRKDERPSEITLMKKGDVGSLGEEVILFAKPLQEKDIEEPQSEQAHSPEAFSAEDDLNHNDREHEQDFISRVFSQPQGPRVHWGSPPERTEAAETRVEEAASEMSACRLSDSDPATSPPAEEGERPPPAPPTTHRITQVGVSKRGAAGLQDLLRKSSEGNRRSVRQNLLACLRATFKDWCTDATLDFLNGADHVSGPTLADAGEEREEELDEDDLDEDDAPGPEKAPSSVPDFEALRKDTRDVELRVREFYKGTWILPEPEDEPGEKVTAQDQAEKRPALPLVDSRAQHVIQKRITVEKLTACLKHIIGPLQLTVSDIATDLNDLVRTFKFTNTNIIHKPPEWTIIAAVLLHVLAEVSPLAREALRAPASSEHVNALMKELGLHEQDLLDLVRVFKRPRH